MGYKCTLYCGDAVVELPIYPCADDFHSNKFSVIGCNKEDGVKAIRRGTVTLRTDCGQDILAYLPEKRPKVGDTTIFRTVSGVCLHAQIVEATQALVDMYITEGE